MLNPARANNSSMRFSKELEAAREAAAIAGKAALRYWRGGIVPDIKPDNSPVTAADRESERLLVQHLLHPFPEDGVLGEEGANKEGTSGRRWILDPIDGTVDFVRGSRLWCVLVALEQEGDVVVGVAHFPALGETYWASRGGGAFRDGTPVRISQVTGVDRAIICMNGINNRMQARYSGTLLDWIRPFWALRSMGGCLDAMLVASGGAEVWIDPSGKAWDLAAPKIIGEEAGGCFFAFDGSSSPHRGNGVICAPAFEEMTRRFIATPQPA